MPIAVDGHMTLDDVWIEIKRLHDSGARHRRAPANKPLNKLNF